MHHLHLVGLCLMLAACEAGPKMEAGSDQRPFTGWSCPAKGTVVRGIDDSGERYTNRWIGSDPDNPDLCLRAIGRGGTKQRAYLYGLLPAANLVMTSDERAVLDKNVGDFMHGRVPSTQFIIRSDGQQVVNQFSVAGVETLTINGKPVRAIKIHDSVIYGWNTRMAWNDIWFDLDSHAPVKFQRSFRPYESAGSRADSIEVRP